jgi:hypothetical protein
VEEQEIENEQYDDGEEEQPVTLVTLRQRERVLLLLLVVEFHLPHTYLSANLLPQ